jgi:hypothetical protein
VHKVGNIALTVTNWGFFGSETRRLIDPCTRLPAESFEFPIGTGIEYLFQGALWIGAVVDKDTLVSVGNDGWLPEPGVHEFYADEYPEGDIIERTNRPILRQVPNSTCPDVTFSEDAVSEQDFIAVYTDTLRDAQYVAQDPTDGRSHIPLGLQITQESYAWSFDYADEFVLMHMRLKNISGDTLKQAYMGLYMDQDVAHQGRGNSGAQDDITGFTQSIPSPAGEQYLDTVNMAWIADADGDPIGGEFYFGSPTGVAGVRVVQAPAGLQFSFNWWISNSTANLDWGPNKANTKVQYRHGNLGSPEGDVCKYQVLSNGEFDYVQVEAAIDHSIDGWLPPPSNGEAMARGIDTRYLLSFGPFNILPDSTLPLTIALVAGSDFHTNPMNFTQFFDPADPSGYLDNLDLTNFARNAQWAGWVYDTPGFDTDGDGTRGSYRLVGDDSIYYTGDGVPDFQGPPPPPAPLLSFETFRGRIVMRWNGQKTETERDIFSLLPDFEGYRVYMSRTGQLADFALLAQRDEIDYVRYAWRADALRWVVKDPPFRLDSLKALYGYAFHPDSFAVRDTASALVQIVLDESDPSKLDTNYYAFERFDANERVDDRYYAYLVDSLGRETNGVIRKVYPEALVSDTGYRPDGTPFAKYYEYEYAVSDLALAEPVTLAVTTFDYGNPAAGLSSLESSPLANSTEVWPIASAEVIEQTRPKPGVYPNPYRAAEDYNSQGWEDPGRLGTDPERARKVTFTNVPDTCTVSIWTLDGDLVRKLDHRENPGNSQATVVVWDLITRNTQAVKSGVYLYTIESRFGTDVGKLVIIK